MPQCVRLSKASAHFHTLQCTIILDNQLEEPAEELSLSATRSKAGAERGD